MCARPLYPTLSTLLACTGRRLVHKTTRPRSTSLRSLQVYLIVCASSITSASSPTTHASVPWHLLDKQSGPQNPLCYRTNNELKLGLTDHPRSSCSLLADDHVLTRPLAETRQALPERQHNQHKPTSEEALGNQRLLLCPRRSGGSGSGDSASPTAAAAAAAANGKRTMDVLMQAGRNKAASKEPCLLRGGDEEGPEAVKGQRHSERRERERSERSERGQYCPQSNDVRSVLYDRTYHVPLSQSKKIILRYHSKA